MEANTSLLYLEKDRSFDRIEGLSWYPWIGSNYFRAQRRVLIVGESHYNTGDNIDEANIKTIREKWTTRDVVQTYPVSHDRDNNMFENLHRCLFQTNHIDRESVWKNVAFYNFVQRPMNYNGKEWEKERPTRKDIEIGWRVFVDVVNILQPTDCLFVGVAAADAFNENMKTLGISYDGVRWNKVENCKRYARCFKLSINDFSLKCIAIQHTSQYFSWSAWNAYLDKENHEMLKYLKQLAHIDIKTPEKDDEFEADVQNNNIPYWLQHKPIYACNYTKLAPTSDLKYISVGRAQWDNKCSASVKSFRWNESKKRWSRMSEEIPIDRLPEMTMMLLSSIAAVQASRAGKPIKHTYLQESFATEEANFLDDQFHKNADSLRISLSEMKRLLDLIDLDNI